jgi:hypothetical protein
VERALLPVASVFVFGSILKIGDGKFVSRDRTPPVSSANDRMKT